MTATPASNLTDGSHELGRYSYQSNNILPIELQRKHVTMHEKYDKREKELRKNTETKISPY